MSGLSHDTIFLFDWVLQGNSRCGVLHADLKETTANINEHNWVPPLTLSYGNADRNLTGMIHLNIKEFEYLLIVSSFYATPGRK